MLCVCPVRYPAAVEFQGKSVIIKGKEIVSVLIFSKAIQYKIGGMICR